MNIPLLPRWNLQPNRPSFFDTDSATLLELASVLHSSMNNVIEEYNNLSDNVNNLIQNFVSDSNADYEVFRTAIRQEFQDFIDIIDIKYQAHDNTINDAFTNIEQMISDKVIDFLGEGSVEIVDNVAREQIAELTPGKIGAAPAGFGLGGSGEWVEDLNSAKKNGFYSWTDTAQNKPFNYGNLLVLNRLNSRVTQIGIDPKMGGFGTIAIRHCTNVSNGEWAGWEYVNPVMSLGTEYRTIEGWKGNAVYTKVIDFGAMPNASSKTVSTGVDESNIIRAEVLAKNGTNCCQLPYFLADGTLIAKHLFSSTGVQITTSKDWSEYTGSVQIWYTK